MTTVITPDFLPQPIFGQNLPALCAIGSTGSAAFTAKALPLRENLPTVPNGTRVPSGKISSESPFFSERERAALAWADAVNALPHRDDTDAAWPALREHFSENEIAELGYTIAAIRGWNVLNLSLRNQIPVHPAPGM